MTDTKYGERDGLYSLEPASSVFDRALVEQWQDADEPKPMRNPAKPIRHSWAGKCPRQMAYYITGRESPPMEREGIWVTSLGTMIHELWQEALDRRFESALDVRVEHEVRCETDISSGSADSRVTVMEEIPDAPCGVLSERAICVELKTINGMGYKQVVSKGPRYSHFVQACINGHAMAADEAKIVYLPMETNRKAEPQLRIGATFTVGQEQMIAVAERELKRWRAVLRTIERGYLPPRQVVDDNVPVGAVVEDPMEGKLDKGGRTWQCNYCPFQIPCLQDGGGLVQIATQEVDKLWDTL